MDVRNWNTALESEFRYILPKIAFFEIFLVKIFFRVILIFIFLSSNFEKSVLFLKTSCIN